MAAYAFHEAYPTELFALGLLLVPLALQAWLPSTALLWNSASVVALRKKCLYASLLPFARLATSIRPLLLLAMACGLVLVNALLGLAINQPSYISGEWWHHFCAYFPLWHLPQFIFGVALGQLFLSRQFSGFFHESLLWGAIVTLIAILASLQNHPWLSSNIILAPTFGALIFGFARNSGLLSQTLAARSLVLLGDASYSIYILHLPIWVWWNHLTLVSLKLQLPLALDFACYLLLVVSISVLMFLRIERPAQRWLHASRHLKQARSIP